MKKIISTVTACFFVAMLSHAQNSSFGFHAGTAMSKMTWKEDNESYTMDHFFGIQLGFVADLPIGKKISLQPGLNFLQKGGKDSDNDYGSEYEAKWKANTIEIPVNIIFHTPGEKGKFFIGAGPAIAFALSGKVTEKYNGEETTEKLKFGNDEDNDDARAMDLGINALAGYQLKSGLFFGANYNIGVRNLYPGGDKDFGTVKSSYFGIRVGYMFGNR